MKCKVASFLISSFIDGELTETERATLEEHLKICPICKKELENMRDISSALKSFKPEVIPAGTLMPAITETISRRENTKEYNIFLPFPTLLRRLLVGGAVAAALVAGIFVFARKDKNLSITPIKEKPTYTILASYPSDDENFDDELIAIYYNNYAAMEQDVSETKI